MSLITYNQDDRVMIFVDVMNVSGSIRVNESLPFRMDFASLARNLTGSRKVVGTYAFNCKLVDQNGNDRNESFHEVLRRQGFRVFAEDSLSAGGEQKEVDVAMACTMLAHALRDNYDVAIVVSGDRDFVPAVREVQNAGKRMEVASFSMSISRELRQVSDLYVSLDRVPLLSMVNNKEESDIDGAPAEALSERNVEAGREASTDEGAEDVKPLDGSDTDARESEGAS